MSGTDGTAAAALLICGYEGCGYHTRAVARAGDAAVLSGGRVTVETQTWPRAEFKAWVARAAAQHGVAHSSSPFVTLDGRYLGGAEEAVAWLHSVAPPVNGVPQARAPEGDDGRLFTEGFLRQLNLRTLEDEAHFHWKVDVARMYEAEGWGAAGGDTPPDEFTETASTDPDLAAKKEALVACLLQRDAEVSRFPKVGLAMTCHWGIQPLFEALPGVVHCSQGFGGRGLIESCGCAVDGGPNESVRVAFDPAVVSLEALLTAFLAVFDHREPAEGRFPSEVYYYCTRGEIDAVWRAAQEATQDGHADAGAYLAAAANVALRSHTDYPFVPSAARLQGFFSRQGNAAYPVYRPIAVPLSPPHRLHLPAALAVLFYNDALEVAPAHALSAKAFRKAFAPSHLYDVVIAPGRQALCVDGRAPVAWTKGGNVFFYEG
eukprot:TRINITY_DN9056_c0_g1_i1.p1 TRINITY_DN9056_c0_g1~~TRINITY_DN9056_c0_g1_i1.p1  ORF type:complete len:432 (+),score=128.16 TRINITY_DN9056_c0_g1_i1:1388-2683(+)